MDKVVEDRGEDQLTVDMFTAQSVERHTKRQIAGILSDLESFTGIKDKRRSQIVKDIANYSKRVMLTKLTGLVVESSHEEMGTLNDSHSGRFETPKQAHPDDGDG